EPWADAALPEARGLLLWLDASRQAAARKAHGLPPLADGARLGVCYDGSGHRRHAVQRLLPSQPRLPRRGRPAAVRFHHRPAHLPAAGPTTPVKELPLFVVAAPRSNAGLFRALVAGNETGKNDYTTGFTVDLTGEGSARLDRLNVEGRGFGGAVNLLRE